MMKKRVLQLSLVILGILGVAVVIYFGVKTTPDKTGSQYIHDKTTDSELPTTGIIHKLSSLSPLLGKTIQLRGLVVRKKGLPYLLINNRNNLKLTLGFTDQVYPVFFKDIKIGINYNKDSQYAEISGCLKYLLTDFSLEKNKKFKEDLEQGQVQYPYPPQYGEFKLINPKVIRIIDNPTEDDLTVFPIPQIPSNPEEDKIKDSRFLGDGNMEKFNEYIEHLKKEKN